MIKFTDAMKNTGFELMPEGVTILCVEEIKPVQAMGKIKEYKARFKDAKGRRVFNDYKTQYDGAMRSFYAMLTKGCALEEDANGEMNEQDAVGKYIVARIKHTQGNDDRVFVNLGYVMGSAKSFNDDISQWTGEESPSAYNTEDDPYA